MDTEQKKLNPVGKQGVWDRTSRILISVIVEPVLDSLVFPA